MHWLSKSICLTSKSILAALKWYKNHQAQWAYNRGIRYASEFITSDGINLLCLIRTPHREAFLTILLLNLPCSLLDSYSLTAYRTEAEDISAEPERQKTANWDTSQDWGNNELHKTVTCCQLCKIISIKLYFLHNLSNFTIDESKIDNSIQESLYIICLQYGCHATRKKMAFMHYWGELWGLPFTVLNKWMPLPFYSIYILVNYSIRHKPAG